MIKAVILAAGRGERLEPFTSIFPKPLISINKKPLIEHVLDALRKAGIKDCIIVTGYMGQKLRKHLGDGSKFHMRIGYCYNPSYTRGNALSLKAAKKFLEKNERFLLTMADHLVSKEIIDSAFKNIEHAPLICVDRQTRGFVELEEATKVLVGVDGYVKDIGKEIPSWNAVDTGVFLFDHKIFEAIRNVEGKYSFLTLSRCIKQMIREGVPLWACDVSGKFWMDIDTSEHVALAEQVLRSI